MNFLYGINKIKDTLPKTQKKKFLFDSLSLGKFLGVPRV